jgi:hypothetical protein
MEGNPTIRVADSNAFQSVGYKHRSAYRVALIRPKNMRERQLHRMTSDTSLFRIISKRHFPWPTNACPAGSDCGVSDGLAA